MAEIFDKGEVVVEPAKAVKKPRKKRAPLSASKKAALVERLKVAREKKAAQRKKAAEPIKIEIEEPKPVVKKVKAEVKAEVKVPEPKNNKYRENQMELENLRQELEMQNLKNQLEDSRRSKKQPVEEPPMIVNEPDPIIQKVEPVVIKETPKQPTRYSLAPKNIWGQF